MMENGSQNAPGNSLADRPWSTFFATFSEDRLLDAFWSPIASLRVPFWLPLGPFWLPLATFWLPFGSLLGPFWIPFGSLLVPFGCFVQYLNSLGFLLSPYYPF